jgi:hypothetical protein
MFMISCVDAQSGSCSSIVESLVLDPQSSNLTFLILRRMANSYSAMISRGCLGIERRQRARKSNESREEGRANQGLER